MASAKQLAALKKGRATRLRNLRAKKKAEKPKKKPVKKTAAKKKPAVKKVVRKYTRKAAPRKTAPKKRANKESVIKHILVVVRAGKAVGYWTGKGWDDQKSKAHAYATTGAAETAWKKASKLVPAGYSGRVDPVKK